jgi:hypothetical protein
MFPQHGFNLIDAAVKTWESSGLLFIKQ